MKRKRKENTYEVLGVYHLWLFTIFANGLPYFGIFEAEKYAEICEITSSPPLIGQSSTNQKHTITGHPCTLTQDQQRHPRKYEYLRHPPLSYDLIFSLPAQATLHYISLHSQSAKMFKVIACNYCQVPLSASLMRPIIHYVWGLPALACIVMNNLSYLCIHQRQACPGQALSLGISSKVNPSLQ